jgi:hypothetical protein
VENMCVLLLTGTCGELVCSGVVRDLWRTGVYWCFQGLVKKWCVLVLSRTCRELVCTGIVQD